MVEAKTKLKCPNCQGHGTVKVLVNGREREKTCPACNGTKTVCLRTK